MIFCPRMLQLLLYAFLGFFILIAAGVLVGVYLYFPLKIRSTLTEQSAITFDPIDPSSIPDPAALCFANTATAFTSQNFQYLGTFVFTHAVNNQIHHAAIWADPQSTDIACVSTITQPSPTAALRLIESVAFTTEFTDGYVVTTSNLAIPDVFPSNPRSSEIRCPGTRNFHRLREFHRARVIHSQRTERASLASSNAPAYLAANQRDLFTWLISAGYYFLESDNCCRMTRRGAYLMTYRLLPPLKQLRRFTAARRTNKALRILGFPPLPDFCR